jgi:hypothetical protein
VRGLPGGSGSLSVDEKTAILIKSYELEPLPKLSLEIGENPTKKMLHSGQYLGHLLRIRNLHWIGFDRDVQLLDSETAKTIRDDPVYGFSHYIVDHGVANVFGRQIFEGKMPLEPAIGAASAIGIVEQDKHSGKTQVYTKKQLGIKSDSARGIAKKYYTGKEAESAFSNIKKINNKDTKRVKQNYEIARDEILKRKEEKEKELLDEDDIEPSWIKNDEEILRKQELKEERTPELLNERIEVPLNIPRRKDRPKERKPEEEKEQLPSEYIEILDEEDEDQEEQEEEEIELGYEEPDDEDDIIPVDYVVKKNNEEEEDEDEDEHGLPF